MGDHKSELKQFSIIDSLFLKQEKRRQLLACYRPCFVNQALERIEHYDCLARFD